MTTDTDDVKNVGYGVFKELYKQLEIDKFWNWKTRNLSIRYNVDRIFRLLVFSRILAPASKKATFDERGFYFEDFGDFSFDDVYHALDVICANKEALQKWIYDHSEKICERYLSVSYFDYTNYYFDIGRSDMDILDSEGCPVDKNGKPTPAKYRKRGPEKNHRPDPIVEMGLLMDRKGIPLAFDPVSSSCISKQKSDPHVCIKKDENLYCPAVPVYDIVLYPSWNLRKQLL